MSKKIIYFHTCKLAKMASSSSETDIKQGIKTETKSHKVMVYSKTYCGFCNTAKDIFKKLKAVDVEIKELDISKNGYEIQDALEELTNQRTVPNIFIGGNHIGGCDALQKLEKNGELAKMLADL